MDKRCYHCGEPLSPRDKVCPRCGADANESRKPRTIYELRAYCAQKRVPLEKIRFFIDEDYREPKAFGIYQDDEGQFVVYKNKADGTRAIRYRGPDEAHAVNEILQKLDSEVELRRGNKGVSRKIPERSAARRRRSSSVKGALTAVFITTIILVVSIILFAFISLRNTPRRGYYHYDGSDYYYYNDWYRYEDDEWVPAGYVDDQLEEDFRDYRTDTYDGEQSFEDSFWYDYEYERSHSDDDDDDYDWDDDDDYDWDDDDWDDWDSDDTDWDSDW